MYATWGIQRLMPPTPPYSDCYFENSKHDLGYIYLFINFPSLLLSLISWSTFPQLLSDQMCQDYEMLYNSALDNESLLTKTGCFFSQNTSLSWMDKWKHFEVHSYSAQYNVKNNYGPTILTYLWTTFPMCTT